jgi:pyruvate,water dikinase
MKKQHKWQEYYPMVVVPGAELNLEEDVKKYGSLFLEAAHTTIARTPLMAYYATKFWGHGMSYGSICLCLPTCRGWVYKHYQGGVYIVPDIIRDGDEIKQREVEFQKRMRPWFERFDELWEDRKKELREGFEEIKSFDMDSATPSEILIWHYKQRVRYARMWEIHMEVLQVCFSSYLLLGEVTKERFGMSTTNPEFQKLMKGFDNKVFRVIKELWEFGERASAEGLKPVFEENETKEIIPKLKETEVGRKWLDDFMKFLETDGWWPTEQMEFNAPFWLEDPTIPVGVIKENLRREAEFNVPQLREKQAKERTAATESLLEKVPEEERNYFSEMIKLAGKASQLSEEHVYYCEYSYHSALRYQFLRLANRLVKAGTMDDPEDIFLLNPEEIESVIMVPEANDLRPLLDARRDLYREWLKKPRDPVFTNKSSMEEAAQEDLLPSLDAVIISSAIGELPEVKPELKADIYGVCGAGGEAEGIARVILNYEDLDQVQKGEILVATATDSNWTPVFSTIKGIITDKAGVLSHAAIVAREFGIPAVVNTFVATGKIKTGQRVRIQADKGSVYILD